MRQNLAMYKPEMCAQIEGRNAPQNRSNTRHQEFALAVLFLVSCFHKTAPHDNLTFTVS